MRNPGITRHMRDLERLKTIQAVVDGELYPYQAGLWIPRKLRPAKIQQPRARQACLGELIQID
jgi:hypothetical protein